MAGTELKIKISADASGARSAIDATRAQLKDAEAASLAASAAAKAAAAQESAAKIAAINAVRAAEEVAKAQAAGASAERIKQLQDVAAKMKAVADATQSVGADKLQQLNAAAKAAGDRTGALQAEIKSLESTVKAADMQKPFNGMADKINAAKGSIAGLVASFALFKTAGDAAMNFETAMTKVNIKANLSADGLAALSGELVDMSLKIPMTAVELAAIAEAGASLGIAGKDLKDFTQLTAEMSVGFGMTAEAAGNVAGMIGNIFKLNIEGMREVANTVNNLGDNMATSEDKIVDVMKRAGGAGSQFGLTANGVAALSAAMLSLGDSPEVVGTSINSLLTTLQAAPMQSKGAQQALQTLGFDAKQLATDIEKDAQGTLLKFLKTLEGLDGKSKTMALGAIFGSGGDTASIAKLTGSMKEYETALKLAGEQSNGLAGAVAAMSGTAEGQLKIMGSAFTAIGIAASAALLPVIKATASTVASIAEMVKGFVEAHPNIAVTIAAVASAAVGFGAISLAISGIGAVVGAVIAPIAGIGTAIAGFGSAAMAVAGPVLGLGAAGGTAAVGVGALGASVTALLWPIAAAVAAVTALTLAWKYFSDKADATNAAKSVEQLRKERAALAAEIEATPDTSTIDAAAGIDAIAQRRAQLEDLDKAIAAKAGPAPEPEKPKGAAIALNKAKADTPGQDISGKILAGTDAAQAAMKARLAANAAMLEADAKLRADASKRELEELKRGLELETITIEDFYNRKLAVAQQDADAQIKVKEQEIAQKLAFKPASEADRETQRGEVAKLRADLAIIRRDKLKAEEDIGREVVAARLKAAEEAESRTLAVTARGLDQQAALAKRAFSLGLASSVDLAAMEADIAEKRVQTEIAAKERILAARIAANAAPDQVRQAEADVTDLKSKRTSGRADQLSGITDRIKAQRQQTEEITLKANGDQASLDVIALSRDIQAMRDSAEKDAAVLRVQLESADPEEAAKIRQTIIDLEDSTNAAIVAKNAELADKMKPGWQKMIEGWRDTSKVMREGFDQMGQDLVKNGEDAFVEYATKGGDITKKMLDDMKAQFARMAFRSMMGGAQQSLAGLFGGGQQPGQPAQGGALSGVGAALGMGQQGASPVNDAAKQSADALSSLTATTTATGEAQQLLTVATEAGQVGEELSTSTSAAAMGELALSAQMAAAALQEAAVSAQMSGAGGAGGAGGAAELMSLFAADGAVVPFAKGGSFTNSVVSKPTMFAFSRGGKLGLMGEAGPEAIMPLSGGGVRAVDGSGSSLGRLGVTRDGSGVLSVVIPQKQQFASGGTFGGVRRFASGGVFAGGYNDAQPDAGGSVSISQTFNFTAGGGTSEASMRQWAAQIKAQTIGAVNDAQRRAR